MSGGPERGGGGPPPAAAPHRETGLDDPGTGDHIGVCVCTYKRPGLLGPLLEALGRQRTGGDFQFSLHVVDNDPQKSAEAVVLAFAARSGTKTTYDHEPVQNIALARNRAVRAAQGGFLAFIDDDELPGDDWLARLYGCLKKHGAAGVLGPVRPLFPPEAPAWLVKSGLCDRPSYPSGTVLGYLQTRTGNLLLDRGIIRPEDEPFPPERGRTGGEDIAFFRAMMDRGHVFVWCEEAAVGEIVLAERLGKAFYIQKNLRIGGLSGAKARASGFGRWRMLGKSGCAAAAFAALSVAGLFVGQHVAMRNFAKVAYHVGRIAGGLGYVPIRERREP